MSAFIYPSLSRPEIVAILSECGIAEISEAELLFPNPDFMFNLYTGILFYMDILKEDQGLVDFDALQHLENPDLHAESVRTINLFIRIRKFVADLNCPKRFTLNDLVKPEAERTEFFLSAILNFCLHRETKMNILRPVVDDLANLDGQRLALESRISELNAEIAEYNESRERELPLIQEVDVRVKELRQQISGLNNHQMSLKASIKKMKEKAKEMDEKISSAEFALVQSAQENANLHSKIVQSPDKLQGTLEEKKSIRIEAKNAERASMQSFQAKSATLDVYTKACKKMSKHLTQMQAIQEQVNSAKSIEKDVKILKAKLNDEVVLEKSLEAKRVEREGKADQLGEIRKQLEKEVELNCEEATRELNNVKLEMESKRRDLESRQRNVEHVLVEADAINGNIKSVKESGAAKQQELMHKCEVIKREFDRYSNSIANVIERIEVERDVEKNSTISA